MYSAMGGASSSCAWSFPLSCFVSSGRARGVGCRQCPGTLESSCRTQLLQLWFPLCRSCVTQSISSSISLHQPGTSVCGDDFCFLWGGPVHKRAVFLSVGKYRYKLTSDPCASSINFFSFRSYSSERTKRVDEGQGWILGQSKWCLGPLIPPSFLISGFSIRSFRLPNICWLIPSSLFWNLLGLV